MKPLLVLISAFVISIVGSKLYTGAWDFRLAGSIATGIMLLFTAVGHFAFTRGMSMMLPDFLPYKQQLVYLTGAIEIAAAIGLQIDVVRELTALLLIVFFVLLLPANIYAAMHGLDYEKGTFNGPGLRYLWFRIPLQLLFVAWVYYFSL